MNSRGHESRRALLAVGLALASALFFTMTYVLNRASASAGGHWAWTASLRYLLTLPMLLPLVPWFGGAKPVWRSLRAQPWAWLRCGFIGFVLFYALLALAASSGPSWLIAGSFQFTVIAGMLCSPFLYHDERRAIPREGMRVGLLILVGVLLMQWGHGGGALDAPAWLALLCVLGAATAYPLGNRMLLLHLERAGEELNATQRVFGMTLASQPFWVLLAAWGWLESGPPSGSQVGLAAGVALSAGVIATILFFQATGMVRQHPVALAAAEAMQAAELLFSMLLGALFLKEPWPHGTSLFGAGLVMIGIVLFTVVASRPRTPRPIADADVMEPL